MQRAMPCPDEVWRLFIAIDVPAPLQPRLSRLQEQIRRTGAHVSCLPVEHMHLTLVFLGDTFASRVADLRVAMDAAALAVPPFSIRLSGIGAFGSPRAPRVVWVGAGPPEPLAVLQRNLSERITSLGFAVEDRPFHPHVTLARVRSARNVSALTSWIDSVVYEAVGDWRAEKIRLYRSHLDRPRPTYTVLHAAELKGEE